MLLVVQAWLKHKNIAGKIFQHDIDLTCDPLQPFKPSNFKHAYETMKFRKCFEYHIKTGCSVFQTKSAVRQSQYSALAQDQNF